MKEDLIIFEEFPNRCNDIKNKEASKRNYSKTIFVVTITLLLLLLFFISSVANKTLLDSSLGVYIEKI